jgi:MFS transporter, DHA2 family, methylenomycin A resistance protein
MAPLSRWRLLRTRPPGSHTLSARCEDRGLTARLAVALSLVPLNTATVAIALPAVMADFTTGPAAIVWLLTGYLVVVAALQPVGGWLGDRYGHRQVFVTGLLVTSAGTLLAAAAPTLEVLVVARLLQGTGCALLLANGTALLTRLKASRRAGGMGRVYAVTVAASALGSTVAGTLVAFGGWRLAFAALLPVTLAALAARPQGTPPGQAASEPPAASEQPGRRWAFAGATAGVGLSNLALYALLLVIPLHFAYSGLPPQTAGVAAGVLLAAAGVGTLLGGLLADRLGRRFPALVGPLVAAVVLPIAAIASPGGLVLAGVLAVAGAGYALAQAGLWTAAVEAAPSRAVARASGLVGTSRYSGGIIGSALLPPLLALGAPVAVYPVAAGALLLTGLAAVAIPAGVSRNVPARRSVSTPQSGTSRFRTSSTVSLRTRSRASPSPTRTMAGRGSRL